MKRFAMTILAFALPAASCSGPTQDQLKQAAWDCRERNYDAPEAITACDRLLTQHPAADQEAVYLAARGVGHARVGQDEQAKTDIDAALAIEPRLTTARLQRAKLAEKTGDLASAKADYDQALAEGTRYLASPDDILAVATALRERGALDQALRLAEHGLALPVPHSDSPYAISAEAQRAPLANWAAELAAGMGERERALRAADTALRIAPSLAAYRMVQEQAGDEWERLRGAALARLRNSPAVAAKVDIFLHENMIDDAIAAVRESPDYSLLERVMTAAVPLRPDWVIEAASKQAQRIMEAGKSDRYFYAITWLTLVRDAYKVTGRADEWRAHVQAIRAQHGRKYKLMGMIDQLR